MNRLFCSFQSVLNDIHNIRPKLDNSPWSGPHLLHFPKLLANRWFGPVKPDQLAHAERLLFNSSVVVFLLQA